MMVTLTDEPLSVEPLIAHVSRSGAGGIAIFVGVVRDHADGRTVTLLEYEAYRPMAISEMERIAKSLSNDDVTVAVAHRLGALRVGDIAVVCAASAAHRPAAFVACRALIDEIKAHVPIWKREHGPQGAYWVGWRDARCEHEH
jgi:molybdopterin synthase catalytic subunit